MRVTVQLMILLVAGLFVFFLFYQIALKVNTVQVLAFLFLIAAALVAYLLLRGRGLKGTEMERALVFAEKAWSRTNDGEKLQRLEREGTLGFAGNTAFYSFTFRRLGGLRAQEFAKVIVEVRSSNAFNIAHMDEAPMVKQLGEPFYPLDNEVLFTPVKTPDVIPRYYKTFGGPRPGTAPGVQVNFQQQKDNFDKAAGTR